MVKFIVALVEHRVLGYTLAPYLIKRSDDREFYTITDRIVEADLPLYPDLSEDARQIIRIIEEYSDTKITKLFSKKSKNTQNFLNNIADDLYADHIRPYVERRINRCLDILSSSDIDIYEKIAQNNIYESDKIELCPEPAEAVFNFIKNENGLQYFLTISHSDTDISLTGKEGIILCNEPGRLILEHVLYQFTDINGKKLLPFFNKEMVNIQPAFEKKYLKTFVLNAIKSYRVKTEGFRVIEEHSEPTPVLSLEFDLNHRPVAILKFNYEKGLVYMANIKSELKVLLTEEKNGFYFSKMIRNYETEHKYISKLLSAEFINTDGPYFKPLGANSKSTLHDFINFINKRSDRLLEEGFVFDQKLSDRKFYTGNYKLDIKISEDSSDWFDIKAVVTFNDHQIPFMRFREYILNELKEYELPNGEIFVLPDEWFSKFREIFTFGKENEDNIQLDKQYFALIKKEIKGIDKKYKDKFKDLSGPSKPDTITLPKGVNAKLRGYQREGFQWMYNLYKNNFGACLADDMGLGKTLQTLTFLKKVIDENKTEALKQNIPSEDKEQQLSIFDDSKLEGPKATPSLIVVPVSVIFNWVNEIKKFTPDIRVNAYAGTNRKNLPKFYKTSDVIITSYGIIRNDLELIKKYNFLYLVLDESQMIKNPLSKTYKAINQVNSDYKLVLTGTPIENSLIDMWAQINFINKGLLGNLNFFKSEFQAPIEKQNNEEKADKLRTLIQPFILRRTKGEVAKDLPPVIEQQVFCELTPEQRRFYEEEKSKARNLILENIGRYGAEKSAIMVLQSLTKLRQIANHPILVDPKYEYESGKYGEITRTINNIVAGGHKSLLFSAFVRHLGLIENHIKSENIGYNVLTGDTTNREQVVNSFQEDEKKRCFLISLKAGGVGLNLTAADYVFILDPWWNPASENQAIGRAHRIGQQKTVFVYRFIARDTIEEKILQLKERKSELSDVFINNNNPFNAASVEEVMELFD